MQDQVSAQEWGLRCELAACYQLMDLFGFTDLCSTHVSVRVPGPEHHFLINQYGMLFGEVTASSLVKIDVDGNHAGTGGKVNNAGFVIHSAIHMHRPDIACVLHTHTVANNAIAMVKEGLLPLSQKALVLMPYLAYHDYEGVAEDLDERGRLARVLGEETRILVLRNHGVLTLGTSVGEAFVWNHRFDTACSFQVAGLSMGLTLQTLSEATVDHAGAQARQLLGPGGPAQPGPTEWPALIRLLERERGTSYRT